MRDRYINLTKKEFMYTDLIKYVFDVRDLVKERMNSSQSAVLLRDLFDREHYPDKIKSTNPTEVHFSTVAYRDEEDIDHYCRYKLLINEYVKFRVKTFTGYTLDNYLELTNYERYHIREICIKCIEVEAKAARDAEKASNNNTANMTNAIKSTATTTSGITMEDMFNV